MYARSSYGSSGGTLRTMLSLRSPRLNSKRFRGVSTGSGGIKRSFIRGGGAIGGGIFLIVEESSREGGGGLRSGEFPPCCIDFNGARAGILDGLFGPDAEDMTELARGFRDTLAPKVETGVFARLGGGPRIVPARLGGADFGAVAAFVGMPLFEGVFARGGGAFDAEAYSSSRYRSP
jgi:hypothetical protein